MAKEITAEELGKHTTHKDLWLALSGKVYSVTSFLPEHPGGEEVLMDVSGQDATEAFEDVGHSDEARDLLKDLYVGELQGTAQKTRDGDVPGVDISGNKRDAGSYMSIVFVLVAVVAFAAYKYLY